MREVDLAEEYYKIITKNPKTKMTWDDFFDKLKISKEVRTDFAVEAILNKYNNRRKKNERNKV